MLILLGSNISFRVMGWNGDGIETGWMDSENFNNILSEIIFIQKSNHRRGTWLFLKANYGELWQG